MSWLHAEGQDGGGNFCLEFKPDFELVSRRTGNGKLKASPCFISYVFGSTAWILRDIIFQNTANFLQYKSIDDQRKIRDFLSIFGITSNLGGSDEMLSEFLNLIKVLGEDQLHFVASEIVARRPLRLFFREAIMQVSIHDWTPGHLFLYTVAVGLHQALTLVPNMVENFIKMLISCSPDGSYICLSYVLTKFYDPLFRTSSSKDLDPLIIPISGFVAQPWKSDKFRVFRNASITCLASLSSTSLASAMSIVRKQTIIPKLESESKGSYGVNRDDSLQYLKDCLNKKPYERAYFSRFCMSIDENLFNMSFGRHICLSSPGTINALLLDSNVPLMLFVLSGLDQDLHDLVYSTAEGYRRILSAHEYDLTRPADGFVLKGTVMTSVLFALASNAISVDVLSLRLRVYFGLQLVELLTFDLLEPVLNLIELFSDFQKRSEATAFFNHLDGLILHAGGTNITKTLTESITGALYFLKMHIWRPRRQLRTWTCNEVSFLKLLCSMLGDRAPESTSQVISFLL
jgi:hypothetical protein